MPSDANSLSNLSSDPLIGLTVGDLFKIESLIGVGATSHVYKASHLGLRRSVAIKVLGREYFQADDVQARFHREARIAARIAHPAVVSVLMTGQLPLSDITHGEAYIVYEYVDGTTLSVLQAGEPLSNAVIIGILVAASEAVGAAHELGVVHRDLKPENLMLVRQSDGKRLVRILDFGLAKLHEPTEAPLTHTGAILGTPGYLSPEGARGQAATPQSDVYSLATIAYECFCGYPPFRDSSPIKTLMLQIEGQLPPLTRPVGQDEVPPAVARVIVANLSKSPSQRADTASHFAHALRQAAVLNKLSIEDFGSASALWRSPSDVGGLAAATDAVVHAATDELETP